MQYFKLLCVSPLLPPLCIIKNFRKILDISLVVESLINSKKCFLIQQNKNYSSICKFIIITSLIPFNIAWTDVDARLKQRCINVASTFVSTLSSIMEHCPNNKRFFQGSFSVHVAKYVGATAWKVSVFAAFLVHIFQNSDWIWTRKTLNMNIFHAARVSFLRK